MTITELEHTADIRFRITADNLPLLFEEAASALLDIIFTNREGTLLFRAFRLQADSMQELLSSFLSEILFLADAENIVFSECSVLIDELHNSLSAKLRGVPFDVKKHGGGSEVKGVPLYGLEINNKDGIYKVDLLFDV